MTDFCYRRPMLNRVFRQAWLMDQMMERLGIAPALAARVDRGVARYEARTKCISCRNDRLCLAWVGRSEGKAPLNPPGFCQNADFFRRCRGTTGVSS